MASLAQYTPNSVYLVNGVPHLNGQPLSAYPGAAAPAPAAGGAPAVATNPYAPFPTQMANTESMGLGPNAALNSFAGGVQGPKGVQAPATPPAWLTDPLSLIGLGHGSVIGPHGGADAPPAPPAGPPPVDYGAVYRNSLAQSQAGLTQQFNMAMNDIADRENGANGAVMQMPGQLNDIYNRSDAAGAAAGASAQRSQAASGVRSYESSADQQAPGKAASAQNRATELSSVPLLALAVKTQMAQERGALNDAHQGALNDLNTQAASMAASQAQNTQNEAFQASQAQKAQDYDASKTLQGENYNTSLAQANAANQVDKATGLTMGTVSDIRQSPAYRMVQTLISQGVPDGGKGNGETATKPATAADIEKMFGGNGNLLKVVQLDFPNLK